MQGANNQISTQSKASILQMTPLGVIRRLGGKHLKQLYLELTD
jgi:hypothetical protein